ncbi:unnamed protein product, partial [Musa acuminata subsp. burmannicoides]
MTLTSSRAFSVISVNLRRSLRRTSERSDRFPISSRLVPAASPTILRTLKRPSNLTP